MSTQNQSQPEQGRSQDDIDHLHQEVNQEASPIFDFLVKYAKVIAGVAIGAVAAAAVYAGVSAWNGYTERKAQEQFAQVLSASGEQRITALQNYVDEAPKAVRGGALFELAGALMAEKRYDEAVGVWSELKGEGRPEMRTLASMGMARCLLLNGQADQAMEMARAVVADAPEAMAAPANRLLAACAEAAGEPTLAATALQAVLDSGQAQDAPLLSYRIKSLKGEE